MRLVRWLGRCVAVAGLLAGALLLPVAAASAQTYPTPPTTPTTVDPCPGKGLPVIGVDANGVAICGTVASETASSGLAFTGVDIALLVIVGTVGLAGGFALIVLSRRPRTAAD